MDAQNSNVPNGDSSQFNHVATAGRGGGQGVVQSKYTAQEFEAPNFISELEHQLSVEEGEAIRLFSQVSPAGDNSLSVDWLKDGKPLLTGN